MRICIQLHRKVFQGDVPETDADFAFDRKGQSHFTVPLGDCVALDYDVRHVSVRPVALIDELMYGVQSRNKQHNSTAWWSSYRVMLEVIKSQRSRLRLDQEGCTMMALRWPQAKSRMAPKEAQIVS